MNSLPFLRATEFLYGEFCLFRLLILHSQKKDLLLSFSNELSMSNLEGKEGRERIKIKCHHVAATTVTEKECE